MEREKGTASATCGSCGSSLTTHAQADGSISADRCTKCFPGAKHHAEKAHHQPKREHGSEKVTSDGE